MKIDFFVGYYLLQVIKDFASGEIKEASTLFDCNILSGAESDVIEHMFNYGINLGLSFQIVDEILDFTRSAVAPCPLFF